MLRSIAAFVLAALLLIAPDARACTLSAALARDWQTVVARFPSPSPYLIVVDISRQSLFLLRDGVRVATWPVSTGYDGTGERKGSDDTPLGVFTIVGRLGQGLPEFAALDRFGASGAEVTPVFAAGDRAASAEIVARILFLEGLQPGFNAGGDVDTQARQIYIHGTANFGMLGRPASDGCVQMAPGAVISLYRRVPDGTDVLITPDATAEPVIPGPAPSSTRFAAGQERAGG